MEQNVIQQTTNRAFVVGKLKEKKIEFKMSKNNKPMAMGSLIVVVDNEYGKSEVEVKVMQMAQKGDGTDNALYKGLQTIAQTYKSINEVGEELADIVEIEGSLEDGTYFSVKKGDFVNKLQVKALFINRVDKSASEEDKKNMCSCQVEGYLSSVKPNGDELDIEIVLIGYQGIAIPVSATVPKELAVPFQSIYNVGCVATLNVALINSVETEDVQNNVGFGMGIQKTIKKTTIKRVVFGGESTVSYDRVNQEQVQQAISLRNVSLEDKKKEAIEKEAKKGSGMTSGFNTPNSTGTGFSMPNGANTGFSMPNGANTGFSMPNGANTGFNIGGFNPVN